MEKEKGLLRIITVALKKKKEAGTPVKEANKVTTIAIPSMSDSRLEPGISAYSGLCKSSTNQGSAGYAGRVSMRFRILTMEYSTCNYQSVSGKMNY